MESAILEESAYFIGQLDNKRMLTNVPITGECNLFQAWSNMAYMSGVGTSAGTNGGNGAASQTLLLLMMVQITAALSFHEVVL